MPLVLRYSIIPPDAIISFEAFVRRLLAMPVRSSDISAYPSSLSAPPKQRPKESYLNLPSSYVLPSTLMGFMQSASTFSYVASVSPLE